MLKKDTVLRSTDDKVDEDVIAYSLIVQCRSCILSLIKIRNNKGDSTVPWGTLESTVEGLCSHRQ